MQKNFSRSSSGLFGVQRLVQHPLVELQPAQFTIDELTRTGVAGGVSHNGRDNSVKSVKRQSQVGYAFSPQLDVAAFGRKPDFIPLWT